MAYDLYVLNQRLPRFPLRQSYADPHAMRNAVDEALHAWFLEAIIGNLQRRRACSQVYDFAAWMETQGLFLETVAEIDFLRFVQAHQDKPLCRFGDFLRFARRRLPDLAWSGGE